MADRDPLDDYEEDQWRCDHPGCDFVSSSYRGLSAHKRFAHAERATKAAAPKGTGKAPLGLTEAQIKEQWQQLIEHGSQIGVGLSFVAPHTGLTIASRMPDREVQVPDGKGGFETKTKKGMASVLIDLGRKNAAVMRAITRVNALFAGGEAGELVLSLGAAVVADVRKDSWYEIRPLPGMPGISPTRLFIPDIAAEVNMQQGVQEEMPFESNGYQEGPVEVGVPAGVEIPWEESPA